MMTTPEIFGRKRNGVTEKATPEMPSMPSVTRPPSRIEAKSVHPEAVKHLDAFSAMAEKVDTLESQVSVLTRDNDVLRNLCDEFKRLHDIARGDADHWMAYATETRVLAQAIKDGADRLHQHGKGAQAALKKREEAPLTPEKADAIIAQVESELGATSAGTPQA